MKSLPRSTAKDVFFHLLSVGTLTVAIVSLIALLFQYINVKFPDALDFYYLGSLDIIRQSMASLFIVWPVYVFVTSLIYKDLVDAPGKHETGIRKWLLYLTLFVTSITMIIDLITLVNYFLNGEITTRFILKVLTVLVAAGGVFAYYLWDLRRDPSVKTVISRNVAWGASAVIVASIVLGFFLVGSPAHQRLVRFDDQRANDLSTIQSVVNDYYAQEGTLPATLSDITGGYSLFTPPTDPATNESYTYTVTSETTYEVCATFVTESTETSPRGDYYAYNTDWTHGIGTTCFTREVKPSMIIKDAPINLITPIR